MSGCIFEMLLFLFLAVHLYVDSTQGECNCSPRKLDCLPANAATYNGNISETASGITCMHWTAQKPWQSKYATTGEFPEGSAAKAKNYCRAPEGKDKAIRPWCYTMSNTAEWEFCAILPCDGNNDGACTTGPKNVHNGDCQKDSQCDAGQICLNNYCRKGCRKNEQCKENEICKKNKCVPGCKNDDACPNGEVCKNGKCDVGCRDDLDCEMNFICKDKSCVAGCRSDNDCSRYKVCKNGQCETGCKTDWGCKGEQRCKNGQCVACLEDQDCAAGKICLSGSCKTGCRQDNDCSNWWEICKELKCVDGCRSNSDCDEGYLCKDTVCKAGCERHSECSAKDALCMNQKCEYGFSQYGGKYYKVYKANDKYTWSSARQTCKGKGGDLASIDSSAKQQFVYSVADKADISFDSTCMSYAAFGLRKTSKDGNFEWVDGTALSYTNWEDGMPSSSGGWKVAYEVTYANYDKWQQIRNDPLSQDCKNDGKGGMFAACQFDVTK